MIAGKGRNKMGSSKNYWPDRLQHCRQALQDNGFEAFLAADVDAARAVVIESILPRVRPRSVSWGDSLTLYATGILTDMRQAPGVAVIDPFETNVPRAEIIERRRQALLVDLFFSGSNAVTETGQLVNLDMVGNRIGGVTFGPRHVVIFAGRNKIVDTTADAMNRIKQIAAPANAIRHENLRTPCRKTARCMDCRSPDRICNTWTIVEKSHPAGRIKVVLIDADCGL